VSAPSPDSLVAGFLKTPEKYRFVLLYGSDEGLIRERAQALIAWAAGSLNDPFRVADLPRDQWESLSGEMASLSMMGGRRAVRLRDVTDAATDAVKRALAGKGEALAVLEAPGLSKGKLTTLLSAAADAAIVTCYAETGEALHGAVRAMFAQNGVSADAETIAWICDTLGGDSGILRSEVEKLALYVGAGGRVDLDAAQICAGEGAQGAADSGLLAATSGDIIGADTGAERAMAEGLGGVGLLRMALGHLQKLHMARLTMDRDGISASDAVRSIRPPVFFKAVGGTTVSLRLWSADMLLRAIEEARQAEMACKRTGSLPDLLAKRFVAMVARQAAARAARGR
jgi:DNA polymerase-3 subunit delta